MKNKNNSDKEMAELFYNMYMACIKTKQENTLKYSVDRHLGCKEYYDKFQFFAEKYIDDKDRKN